MFSFSCSKENPDNLKLTERDLMEVFKEYSIDKICLPIWVILERVRGQKDYRFASLIISIPTTREWMSPKDVRKALLGMLLGDNLYHECKERLEVRIVESSCSDEVMKR
jgi:hypothetical protein